MHNDASKIDFVRSKYIWYVNGSVSSKFEEYNMISHVFSSSLAQQFPNYKLIVILTLFVDSIDVDWA